MKTWKTIWLMGDKVVELWLLRRWQMFKGHAVGRVASADISGDSDTLTRDVGAQMWRKVNAAVVPACGCVWRQECLFAQSLLLIAQHETRWASCFFFPKLWDLFWNKKPRFDAVPLHQTLMDRLTDEWVNGWTDSWMDGWTDGQTYGPQTEVGWNLKAALHSTLLSEAASWKKNSREIKCVWLQPACVSASGSISLLFELLLPSVTPRTLTLLLYFAFSVFFFCVHKFWLFFPLKSCC